MQLRRLLLVALAPLVGLAFLPDERARAAPVPVPLLPPQEFVAIADRHVCDLVDGSAGVNGQDGTTTVEVGSRVYWGFGDTYVGTTTGAPNQPNGLGFSASAAADPAGDCVTLDRKRSGATAVPLLPLAANEQCNWPLGMTGVGAPWVHFFYVSVGTCDNAYVPNGIGLGRFNGDQPPSFPTARLGIVWSAAAMSLVWGAQTFIGGPSDGYLYIGLLGPSPDPGTLPYANSMRIARVVASAAALEACVPETSSACQMQYWSPSSQSWVDGVAADQSVFTARVGTNGGAMFGWVGGLNKWLATYATGPLFVVRGRTAPLPGAGWSSQEVLLSYCPHFMLPGLGYCYTGYMHPMYSVNGGNTIYLTMAHQPEQSNPNRTDEYTVFLHEITIGKPVTQSADQSNRRRYAIGSVPGYTPEGTAFYASAAAIPGFEPVYEWVDPGSGDVLLGFRQPDAAHSQRGPLRFYSPPRPVVPMYAHVYEPVYRWDRSATEHVYSPLLGLEAQGYANMGVAFYTLCGDADNDFLSDCVEINRGSSPFAENLNVDNDDLLDENGDPVLNAFGFPVGNGNMQSVAQDNGVRRMDIDNCPLQGNPWQENTDSGPIPNGMAGGDRTNPLADPWGDACDDDDDNDGLSDADEATGCNGSGPTNAMVRDSDGDGRIDGFECRAGSSPADAGSRPQAPGISDDPDRDLVATWLEMQYGSDPHAVDTDGDGLHDGAEIIFWGTDPLYADTDGDGCGDTTEAGSVNGDYQVNSTDLFLIAQRFGASDANARASDVDRNGSIGASDLGIAASRFGPCFPARHVDRAYAR